MNFLQIIALLKLLIENKEQILELIKLIQSLFAAENLIGDSPVATVTAEEVPQLAKAVAEAGLDWAAFIKLLIENLDTIKEIIKSILDVVDVLKK